MLRCLEVGWGPGRPDASPSLPDRARFLDGRAILAYPYAMERADYEKLVLLLLGVIVTFVLGVTLYVSKSVIVPFLFAVLAAYTVEPLIRLLGLWHVPRWLGAVVVVGLLYLGLQLTIDVIASTVTLLDTRLPDYVPGLQRIVDNLPLPADAQFNVADPEMWRELALSLFDVPSIAGAVTGAIANVGLVLVLTVAIIIGRTTFDQRIDEVANRATGGSGATAVIDSIDAGIQRYMLVKTLISLGMGGLVGLIQGLFGSEFAVLWGFLAFVLNFVPTFGPAIAVAPACVMLFLQYPDAPELAVAGTIATVTVPIIIANWVEPRLFGEHLNLNFLAVVLALLFWVAIWGVAGAVIAIPVTLTISLICKEVPALRSVHDLLRQ